MFEDPRTESYISGVAVHWYWDNYVPTSVLDKTHQFHPQKFILPTEACFVRKFWEKHIIELGSWSRGEQYAENIMSVGILPRAISKPNLESVIKFVSIESRKLS